MAEEIKMFLEKGLINIIGGCCGSTPKHIKAISELAANYKPRIVKEEKNTNLRLSGLEPLIYRENSNFLNIGERCNVAGSSIFMKLILNNKYDKALSIAKQQVENGAQILDINLDDGLLDTEFAMRKFVNLIGTEPEIAKLPLMIDSSKFGVIEIGKIYI
jgi:5-methyltetrahydrofolate--homocysteine methyltransferase